MGIREGLAQCGSRTAVISLILIAAPRAFRLENFNICLPVGMARWYLVALEFGVDMGFGLIMGRYLSMALSSGLFRMQCALPDES